MNKEETAKLLGLAAAADNRTVGRANVEMWHEILTSELGEGLPFDDARVALRQHYAASGDWLMPFHIVAGVRVIRAQRRATAVWPDPPAMVTDENGVPLLADPVKGPAYEEWLRRTLREIDNGSHQRPASGEIIGYSSPKGNGIQEGTMIEGSDA